MELGWARFETFLRLAACALAATGKMVFCRDHISAPKSPASGMHSKAGPSSIAGRANWVIGG
jgi:hypothetical protein